MKIFILEDNYQRIDEFAKAYEDHYFVVCNNAEIAVSVLKAFKFDLLLLDHDLDGRVFVRSQETNTGYQVAKEIKETINSTTPVIIHSYNKNGAEKMMSVLAYDKCGKCEHVPFSVGKFFDDALEFAYHEMMYNNGSREKENGKIS